MAHYKEESEYREFTGRAEMQKAINSFLGILEGISIDHDVVSLEVQELKHWYNLYRDLIDHRPFCELLPAIDKALSDQVLTYDEVEDLRWLCKQVSSVDYYNLVTSEIQMLHGLLHGLLADNALTDIEIIALQEWLHDHRDLKGTYPFDEIFSLLYAVMSDGIISNDERNTLKAFFSEFIDTRDSLCLNEVELVALRQEYNIHNICARDPVIELAGRTFCFTGKSSRGTRDSIAELVVSCGGIYNDKITRDTQYLIVGADGSPCWAFSCYGRKVEQAVHLRKKGSLLTIVNENDFWPALEAAK